MKKIAVVLLTVLILCMTACGTKSTLSDFKELVEQGKYTEAVELYIEKGSDNYEIKNAMIDVLKDAAEQAIDEYLNDMLDYEEAQKQVDTVKRVSGDRNIIDDETMKDYDNRLSEANASKVAYDSGKSLLEDKNYTGAIEQFEKVAKNDNRYNDAQQQIANMLKAYKEDVTEKAKKCADEGKYDEADSMLTEALTLLPEDGDLLTLKGTYSANYIMQVIEQANAAFITPKTDYEKALNIIKAAMQKYPEDQQLKEKYDYYMEFEPVSLFNMVSYTSSVSYSGEVTDNTGVVREKAVVVGWMYPFDASFDIGRKYNIFNGIATVPEKSKGSSLNGIIEIYGDGKLLWKNHSINGINKPKEIAIDISGVKDLRIVAKGDLYGFNSISVMLADVTLQKTVK